MESAHSIIECKIGEIHDYILKWYQFQSLWDLQSEQVYDLLGQDLAKWVQILQEIRKSRATFDTSSDSQNFGIAIIEYEQVQTRVNAKYDAWQNSTLLHFAELLDSNLKQTQPELQRARKELEAQSLDSSSTTQAVAFITTVESCKRKINMWQQNIELFKLGQVTLSRHRYRFPPDWLFVDQINSDWSALNEILSRRSKLVDDQIGMLILSNFCSYK